MAKNLVIVDSCILIKAFRKDKTAISDLLELQNRTAYSVVTYLELLVGANTTAKKETIIKIFDSYYEIPLNQAISFKAIEIMHKYISGHQTITIPDCLIAATAIITGFPLFTYNKKDFDFMDGVKLYHTNSQ